MQVEVDDIWSDMPRLNAAQGEVSLDEVAEAVEGVFGVGSVGRAGDPPAAPSEEARAAFVRACILLIGKQRREALGDLGDERAQVESQIRREVRTEIGDFLGVDEQEVFRLHHRAAGERARNPEYRAKARMIEREVGLRHGMSV